MTVAAAYAELHAMVAARRAGPPLTGALDRVAAALGLLLFLPLLLVIAAFVLLGSPGPLFTRTYRAIEGGRLVRPLAFRTHRAFRRDEFDAHGGGRITVVGRVVKAGGVTHLPALVEVALGRMPLVVIWAA